MSTTNNECARLILDTFPHAMRTLAHDARIIPGGQGTVPQYRILGYLHFHGPDSMGRLAEKHGVTLPTMTKIVSGLVDKGFVVREGDERDRRIVLLRLTGDGEALFAQVHQRIEARLAGLVEQMSQEERDALATGLRALHRVISSAGIATPSPTADPP